MSNEAVCRTAPATPGLLIRKVLISVRGLINQTYLAALLPCLVNWYLGGPEKTRADTALTHGLPNPK